MSILTIPIVNPPGSAQPVRGLTWSIKQTDQWRTIIQRADNGRTIRLPRQVNPIWAWEFTWEFISDGWAGLSPTVQSGNSPYTDLQVLMGFRLKMKGAATEFYYAPSDASQTGVQLAAPDANGVVEITHDIGGFKESVQTIPSGTVANVKNNGTSAGHTLNAPGVVPQYPGYTLQSNGTAWAPTDIITCDYVYNYLCAFSEDMQEWENFMFNLWTLQSLKFEQVVL